MVSLFPPAISGLPRSADKLSTLCACRRINGKAYSRQMLKCVSGYVMQDDLVNADLTVSDKRDDKIE
jgi:hypothetical protein